MHFAVLPPEINSGRMYAGPGAGSMVAAATAWDELANELHTTAASIEFVISALTIQPWQGAASASMVRSAQPQLAWLNSTAAQATHASAQVKAAAAAYEAAYTMTVPPPTIAANRAELTALVATNFVGQNTPAIAANEFAYSQMWAQDVAAMYSYAGLSRAATEVAPFAPPEQTTNQDGVAAQSSALAQTATTASGRARAVSGTVMSAVPNALQSLTSATSGLTDFSDFTNPYNLVSLGSGLLGNGVGLIGLSGAAGFISDAEQKVFGPQTVSAPRATPDSASSGEAAPSKRLPDKAATVSAELGRAPTLGAVSVPQGWGANAPEVRLLAQTSPNISSVPADIWSSGPCGGLPILSGAPLTASPARKAAESRSPRSTDAARSRGVLVRAGGVSGDMREITDLLSKLGQLRDSGVLTDQEFSEQKRRLLG